MPFIILVPADQYSIKLANEWNTPSIKPYFWIEFAFVDMPILVNDPYEAFGFIIFIVLAYKRIFSTIRLLGEYVLSCNGFVCFSNEVISL